jgi:hypothetical protein
VAKSIDSKPDEKHDPRFIGKEAFIYAKKGLTLSNRCDIVKARKQNFPLFF